MPRFLFLIGLCLWLTGGVKAVMFEWETNPTNSTGYAIGWGTVKGQYTNSILFDAKATSGEVNNTNLIPNTIYWFAIRSVTSATDVWSDPIPYKTPPTPLIIVTPATPAVNTNRVDRFDLVVVTNTNGTYSVSVEKTKRQ